MNILLEHVRRHERALVVSCGLLLLFGFLYALTVSPQAAARMGYESTFNLALRQGGFALVGALAIAAQWLLSRTVLGRWFYAVGANVRTATVSGVPVVRVIVIAYILSGVFATIGSVFYSARLAAGRPTLGATLLLDVVGATVIGGTSLFGGKGKIMWTVFGVLFFVLLDNSLNLLNLSYFWVQIVKGSVILLAAALDVARTRLLARGQAVKGGSDVSAQNEVMQRER